MAGVCMLPGMRLQVLQAEHEVLVDELDNIIDALGQMLRDRDPAEEDSYATSSDELQHELDVATAAREALNGAGPPWTIEAEHRDLELMLTGFREGARGSLQLGAGGVPWELHPDAEQQRKAYDDGRLDTMTVCDALLARLADGGES